MEGHRTRLVCGATQTTCLLFGLIYLVYTQSSAFDNAFDSIIDQCYGQKNLSNWNDTSKVGVYEDNLKSLLARFVKGDDQRKLESTSFACDFAVLSIVCVASNRVKIDTKTMEIHMPSQFNIPTNYTNSIQQVIRPYAWHQDEEYLSKHVTLVKFVRQPTQTPVRCDFTHKTPALIFSSGSFAGNLFHEFNEIIIPLFITSRLFKSQIQFVIVDYRPSFVTKYKHIFASLSRYNVLNPITNTSVHCFPGSVVGLKFHSFLSINSSKAPEGNSMTEFKKFLRRTYSLKIENVSEMSFTAPVLLLISRRKTRLFLNEDELVGLMEELGFEVVVVRSDKKMSNLDKFAKLVNRCSVFVGAHGAGLTNEVFLPAGAVVVQVVPLGLTWPSAVYFGEPAAGMGLEYLDYNIEPGESSLSESYGPDDPVIVDPGSVFEKGYYIGKEMYLDGQNIRVNLDRFKGTLVEALRLLGRTSPLSSP